MRLFFCLFLMSVHLLALKIHVAGAEDAVLGKLKFFGDIRLRSEYLDNKNFDENRYAWRQRIRMRFGFKAAITETIEAGIRMATGGTNYQATGNQSFDTSNFADFNFDLDRVYVSYRPDDSFKIIGGKFSHPFYCPTEIVWDQDIQPTGAAELFTLPKHGLSLKLAQYVIRETDRANGAPVGDSNSELFVEQLVWKSQRDSTFSAALGAAHYQFSNSKQLRADARTSHTDFLTNKNFGTGLTGPVSDFSVLNVNGHLMYRGLGVPLTLIGEYVNNLGAKTLSVNGTDFGDEGVAWGIMGYAGVLKNAGDFRAGVGYFEFEADSVVANFNSDDLQETNVNSIMVDISYQLVPNVVLQYDGYYQKRNNYALAVANGSSAGVDKNTRFFRHRLNLKVNF